MIKHNHLYILFFLFIYACNSNRINTSNDLEAKIQRIITLQKEAKDSISDSTLIDLKEVDDIINNNKNIPDTLKTENIFRKGYYFKQVKNLDSASYYFHKTIDVINTPITRDRELTYFWNTWQLDFEKENYTNTISVANKYIKLVGTRKDYDGLKRAYNILERTYLELRQYDIALLNNELAQKTSSLAFDIESACITAISRANIYYYYLNKRETAYQILDSISNLSEYNDEVKRQLYRQYGILNYEDSNYEKAIANYKKSLTFLKKNKNIVNDFDTEMLQSYTNIGEAYIELKDLKIADKYIDSADVHVNINTDFNDLSFLNQKKMISNYLGRKGVDNVLNSYNKLLNTQNEFHKKLIGERLHALNSANENEKLLSKKNQAIEIENIKLESRQLFFIISFILFSIIGYLFFRQRKFRFEKAELKMQQRLLRSQMNPHFTFNALSTIQNEIKNNKELASTYLLKFSRLLRLIFENSTQNYVQLEDELELLKKYMDLQLMSFPSRFTYNITLNDIDEEDLLFIPPMIMQPFIENSIEHGFLGIHYEGKIDISLSLNNKFISCSIDDNGIGINKSKSKNKESMSTKLISDFIFKTTQSRISVINKKEISVNETGVKVEFFIPYKLTENG
ncbi:hypothetical protein D7030_01590 [Flavobacteriaceae bacterium AU392]|nr:hypothetical protein D1817_08045 [Flavobacteriaceae bacterium]RKM86570.1 hypothetical protein D7030_01590 [Flavobacteriaceae bacterium AU392]